MFDFLSRGRSKSSTPPPAPRQSATTQSVPAPSAAQREMVRLALHSVLRHKGIPGNWLTCEVTPIQISQQGDAVLVQLVVLKWHDALMQYAPALQLGMVEGLRQFDPAASAAKYHFSWSFAPDCGFTHTQFPDPGFWSTGIATNPAAPVLAQKSPVWTPGESTAATPPASKPKFDLPPTAADLRQDDDSDDDQGFAATQINDLSTRQ